MQTISPLLTDFYQLTMMQAYYDHGMEDEAVFEFFVRKLPSERKFFVASGLEQVVEYLETVHFSEADIDFLRRDGRFNENFLNRIRDFEFSGSVDAMAEGTLFFTDEPILRITAPLPVAQLVETRIINILQFQTLIASKAIRMKQIMPESTLIDYGLRRAHGAEAGLLAARASYIAGFTGTATVAAGMTFSIPVYGTMAHSFIQAHLSERKAFSDFAVSHPDNTVLLLDTYDTIRGAHKAVDLARDLANRNIKIKGVRLDSGDMIKLSRQVRKILDDGGLHDVAIFASGNLDEYALQRFRDEAAAVDGFGIGTKMTTSADVPYLDCAYKLVEYAGQGRRKLAQNKSTWAGRKQVFRNYGDDGTMTGDTMCLAHELHSGEKLIKPVMQQGKRVSQLPTLDETRTYVLKQLGTVPEGLQPDSEEDYYYPVQQSEELVSYCDEVSKVMTRNHD
ncbi:nicotinate phosphoribosyltransferase [Desulfosediminicola ganghwensis]|uniref:nicotinate phosphoribosyltransferase n=1 Tax=Desulfosediminicola ganghwensis TaxID=2569540 RepID=UPI0010AC847F|nr:nicotinate phosphoribosyltransferase [Desulfosediminicola ganghwensis]